MNNSDTIKDEELVLNYIDGNDQAFVQIVNQNLKPAYNFAYRLCGSEKDAEEIVQESFVKLWKNIRKYKPGEKFKTWFFTIVRNTTIDYMRKKKHVAFSAFENDAGDNILENSLESEELPADKIFEKAENKKLLQVFLEELPEYYREILYLYYNEGLNFDEVSEILARPLNTVKSQHRRALIILRKRIDAPKFNY